MSEMWELDQGPPGGDRRYASGKRLIDPRPSTSDLHAWSIFRQNLNSDFTDSALGAEERSPLPYGNFTLKEETVHSIMKNPRLGPTSDLASNAFSYLKFGLPRVLPPTGNDGHSSGKESPVERNRSRARSETDIRQGVVLNRFRRKNRDKSNGLRAARSEGNIVSESPHPMSTSVLGFSGQGHRSPRPQSSASRSQTLPHLQVRGLSCVGRNGAHLENISFDLHGGEMMALMATNAMEGTTLLEALAERRYMSAGELVLNGNLLHGGRLGRRLGFVQKTHQLHPELTASETLLFYASFKRTMVHTPSSSKVSSLLELLGLNGVSRTLVSSLTPSEQQRLAVGCQLIQETQILLLDGPMTPMDIFDTFFLMNFLEEWTRRSPGIAIIAIHPPTFEVFSAFTKILLLSSGRTLFYGHRSEILPYFAFIDYPCPPFKNPSDYYIDLVTRDDLSAEALLESTQRIQGLADAWARREESPPDPGPPITLPPSIKRPSGAIFGEILLIWRYLGFLGFQWRLLNWFLLILAATTLSVAIGGIYWDVRLGTPAHVNSAYDRLGQQWTFLVLLPFPIFLLLLSKDQAEVDYVLSDIQEGLYSRAAFFLAQVIGEFPLLILLLGAYVLPGLAMGGIRDMESFFASAGYAVLYLYLMQAGIRAIAHFSRQGTLGLTIGGFAFFVLSLSAGYVLHPKDIGSWVSWTAYLSPVAWILPPIAKFEFANTFFELCSNPIVKLRGNLLMRELSCGLSKGANVLSHYAFQMRPIFLPIVVTIGLILLAQLIALIAIIMRKDEPKKRIQTLML